MKVFISWSGEKSKIIAEALYKYLPLIIQAAEPWMSAHDIKKGTVWAEELKISLDECNFGILCLTPENLEAPWIIFEAGALSKSKSVGRSRVVPYLLDVDFSNIEGPLEQFNGANADKDETRKLFNSIRETIGEATPNETQFNTLFETFWNELEAQIKAVSSRETVERATGAEAETLNESETLDSSSTHIKDATNSASDKLFGEMLDAFGKRNITELDAAYEKLSGTEVEKSDAAVYEAVYLHFRFLLGDGTALDKLKEIAAGEDVEKLATANRWIAESYRSSENFSKAIEFYEIAATKTDKPVSKATAKRIAAECMFKIGDKEKAFNLLFNEIKETVHTQALSELFVGLAELYELDESYELRAACLEKALESRPNDTNLHFNAGYAYMQGKAETPALSLLHYKTLLPFNEEHEAAWNNLGVSYNTFNLSGLSTKAFKKAAELNNTLAASNLANSLIEEGFYDEAKDYLDKAQQQKQVHKNVGITFSKIIERQEWESEELEKTLISARRQQQFILLFAEAFFTEQNINPVFAGYWKSNDGRDHFFSQEGDRVDGIFRQSYATFKLKGQIRNRGGSFMLLEKGYSSFSEVGHGYMYLSKDGDSLYLMTIKKVTFDVITLKATIPDEDAIEILKAVS